MSNEVTQWLAEIRAMKQQIAELERDRDAAYASEGNWRNKYTTEAQQRRTETKVAQEQVEALKAEIQQLQGSPRTGADEPAAVEAVRIEVEQLQTLDELKAKLAEVILERDRLSEALKTEQANHTQTRKSLTTVIGDTIDKLAKERQK